MTSLVLAIVFAAPPELEAHFEAKVRPILVEHCQNCHGPKKQNGGLRLDLQNGAKKGGDSGPALVPGKPEESLLVKAVRRHPDVSAMPPGAPLSPEAVRTLEEWIMAGAAWPESKSVGGALGDVAAINERAKSHWSFQPIRHSKPPTAPDDWSFTSLDAFLRQKMVAAGVEPAPDADRATLLRRVSFDLIGLPPTPEDADAFQADPDATPLAFAKVVDRMLASPRYGERWGRHWLDVARYADTKGYVFQEERRYPFSYTYRDWVVDAFNEDLSFDEFVRHQVAGDRLKRPNDRHLAAMGFLTVGRRFLQDVHEITDDRIDVVTRGFLGLTVSCARCHDHKYDPISMADYYGLYGVFASSEEPKELPVLVDAAGGASRADFDAKMKARTDALKAYMNEQHAVVETRLLDDAEKLLSLSLKAGDKAPREVAEAARQQGLAIGGVRRWFERWRQLTAAAAKNRDPALAAWAAFASIPEKDFSTKAQEAAAKLRKDFERKPPLGLAKLVDSPLSTKDKLPRAFAEAVREAAKSPKASEEFPTLFGADGAFKAPKAEVQQYFDRRQRERMKALERSIEELKVKHPGAEARAMVMVDKQKPVQPHVFLRGNPGRVGPPTERAFLTVLTDGKRRPFKDGSGRRELADAIVASDNPLTARVFVNRAWQWRFGRGLAPSPSDFGLRSDPPSHPALLDHLAARFIADGWSVKKLHRWMLHSRAYQTSSVATAGQCTKDPDNRLLARFPRLRLEWEALRDAVLATSGSLDPTVGGRPVPLFAEPMPTRRTLYGFIDRQNLDGAFRTFDFATPDATSPQRFVTIVPQQGLFLLNSKFVLTEAERMAARPDVATQGDVRKRAERMFRMAYGRAPHSEEIDRAVRFLESQPEWSAVKQVAWTRLAQALMMSNEFAFVD
jgi:hypothetical protein